MKLKTLDQFQSNLAQSIHLLVEGDSSLIKRRVMSFQREGDTCNKVAKKIDESKKKPYSPEPLGKF